LKIDVILCLITMTSIRWGTNKVLNEIETKRNEINENETKRNQQKRNETKRNPPHIPPFFYMPTPETL
jgi:hypothetical protein